MITDTLAAEDWDRFTDFDSYILVVLNDHELDKEVMMRRSNLVLCAVALLAVQVPFEPAKASEDLIYQSLFGTAIDGTDPVSYFTEGRPVQGQSDISHEWNGATWYFSSDENRALFAAAPESYAPQYGGYCAWAVAQGYTASTDPDAWSIVDGRLYLNYSLSVQDRWEQDVPGHIAAADQNWPGVLQ